MESSLSQCLIWVPHIHRSISTTTIARCAQGTEVKGRGMEMDDDCRRRKAQEHLRMSACAGDSKRRCRTAHQSSQSLSENHLCSEFRSTYLSESAKACIQEELETKQGECLWTKPLSSQHLQSCAMINTGGHRRIFLPETTAICPDPSIELPLSHTPLRN
jgi:hypothetical protein